MIKTNSFVLLALLLSSIFERAHAMQAHRQNSASRSDHHASNQQNTNTQYYDNNYNHHQRYLERQIVWYLYRQGLAELAATDDTITPFYTTERAKIARQIEDGSGLCAGLSALWAYGKRVSDKENQPLHNEKDDSEFFNRVYRKLALWDTITPFSNQEIKDIERFVSHVLLFHTLQENAEPLIASHRPEEWQDPLNLLELAGGEKPQENVYLRLAPFSKKMLCEQLEKIVQPGHIIFIYIHKSQSASSEGHAVALYKNSHGNLWYYDANSFCGERFFPTLQDAVEYFWLTNQFISNKNIRYVAIQSIRFSTDAPYVGPTNDKANITHNDIIDILQHERDFSPWNQELYDFFKCYPLSIKQSLEILRSQEIPP